MAAPTRDQRRFLELLRDGRKEHQELARFFDFDDTQVVAEVIDTYMRKPSWVVMSLAIPHRPDRHQPGTS
jgi:hypothetical protein